jgi:2-polyprenyl-3-methyl-5-hydroxy-6-metoxy-1,4-benzoquinol methylase
MPEGRYANIRCRSCGGHYVDSDVSDGYLSALQAVDILEKHDATIYERDDIQEKIRTRELEEHWAIVRRLREPKALEQLLDYGSAWGAFGSLAQADGVVPNGVELQPSGVAHSRAVWGQASVVHDGSLETAPFAARSFAYVTAFETLEHVADPVGVAQALARLVREDGVMAISVPSAHYFAFKFWLYQQSPIRGWLWKHLPGNMQHRHVLIHNHITTPSLRAARLLLTKAGLKVLYARPYCGGMDGGRAGKFLKLVGKVVWRLSGGRIAFAPSIILVGAPASTQALRRE